ncbi:MAG: tetratricopeptide repeat protein [Deltaproteobacteria bacterium]|nr:tetratricopeptide repeat protein [Deltaproteobacteria bacterium]
MLMRARLWVALTLALALVLCAGTAGAYRWAQADVNRALDAHRRGELVEALRLYTLAIDSRQLEPYGLSVAYNDRAAAWADQADALLGQGDKKKAKKSFDQAMADYGKAIDINPTWGMLFTNRGLTWQRLGRYQKALDDFDRSIDVEAGYGPGYQAKAWLLATCPDPKFRNGPEALDMARQAVFIERTQGTLDTLAAALARVGDYVQAAAVQEQAIDIGRGPEEEEVAQNLQRRLQLYRQKKPYTDPPPPGAALSK